MFSVILSSRHEVGGCGRRVVSLRRVYTRTRGTRWELLCKSPMAPEPTMVCISCFEHIQVKRFSDR